MIFFFKFNLVVITVYYYIIFHFRYKMLEEDKPPSKTPNKTKLITHNGKKIHKIIEVQKSFSPFPLSMLIITGVATKDLRKCEPGKTNHEKIFKKGDRIDGILTVNSEGLYFRVTSKDKKKLYFWQRENDVLSYMSETKMTTEIIPKEKLRLGKYLDDGKTYDCFYVPFGFSFPNGTKETGFWIAFHYYFNVMFPYITHFNLISAIVLNREFYQCYETLETCVKFPVYYDCRTKAFSIEKCETFSNKTFFTKDIIARFYEQEKSHKEDKAETSNAGPQLPKEMEHTEIVTTQGIDS